MKKALFALLIVYLFGCAGPQGSESILLDQGPEVVDQNPVRTPKPAPGALVKALKGGATEAKILALIKAGADNTAEDDYGSTPIEGLRGNPPLSEEATAEARLYLRYEGDSS